MRPSSPCLSASPHSFTVRIEYTSSYTKSSSLPKSVLTVRGAQTTPDGKRKTQNSLPTFFLLYILVRLLCSPPIFSLKTLASDEQLKKLGPYDHQKSQPLTKVLKTLRECSVSPPLLSSSTPERNSKKTDPVGYSSCQL